MYPHESLAAQTLGYTREISGAQLGTMGRERYRPGDIVGQSGLEKVHESILGGEPGYIQVEVDARGRRRAELGIIDTVPGNDLYLTLDLDLQMVAEEAFEGKNGAVVGIDPRNGDILVMASLPSFDPNLFSNAMSSKDWKLLTQDKGKPLRNRAISSLYPPGSTIKLFWALAGLAEGVITESTTHNCPGYYTLRGRRFHCHKRAGHGRVNLKEAIRLSCNVYFYQLGLALGIDRLSAFMEELGFGQTTGVNLSGEEKGTLPSRRWKKSRYGERWYDGDTLPVAIGQGYLSVTPIQLASMMAALGNDGKVYKPRLVSKVVDAKTGELRIKPAEVLREVDISPKYFSIVREGALEVVEHPRGTGKRSAVEGIAIGGKTGTAQVISLKASNDSESHQDHSLFVGLAPIEDPTIALFVVVEHGGHGGSAAAPIAGKIFRKYFEKKGMVEPLPTEPEVEGLKPEEVGRQEERQLQRARLADDGIR
jgi:penicillin-binding protein 2